ncbi:hypothetical protein [Lacisediminihabitans sp.]|uniref:hypothetical protein n=1 Tax=Lacisediminihabitans sp. TaxID=2787631 RepID=UPI00374DA506
MSAAAWTTLVTGDSDDRWMHSGVGVLSDGRVVFAEPGGGALVILDEATGDSTRVPTGTADAHGISVLRDPAGDQVWIADPGPGADAGQLIRVALDGSVVDRVVEPGRAGAGERWKPTSSAVVTDGPHTGDLWIADGYGQSLVHLVRADGETFTLDGTSASVRFDCPHGVAIDERGSEPLVVVADRGNRRVVFFDLDGGFVRTVADPVMTSPSSLAVRGDDLLVTDLFGALLRIDSHDAVHAVVPSANAQDRAGWPNRVSQGETVRPDLRDGILNSPHGIAVSDSGDVYLTEWMFGGRVVRLALPEGTL